MTRHLAKCIAGLFLFLGGTTASSNGVASEAKPVTALTAMSLASTARSATATSPDSASSGLPDYYTDFVEPIFAKRCTVCHGCTDSPCQLKLTSYEGLKRGLSQEVALGFRGEILASRMKDAPDTQGWRDRKFTPVVPDEPSNDIERNKIASILYHAITAGQSNKADAFNADAVRPYYKKGDYFCPKNTDDYHAFINENPEMGMPLGLPALEQSEYKTLVSWLEAGAPGPSSEKQAARLAVRGPEIVAKWEAFFNRPDAKSRLTARYIYEHVAGLRFHFEESPGEYFELVRSRTAAPELIQEIVTETPPSNPGTSNFAYRLQKLDEIFVKKSHIVWSLNAEKLDQLAKLFNSIPWSVPDSYVQTYSGNPFRDFKAIPAEIRSRFLMTHSHLMIDQMVRGTVCLGTGATFAIRDHFWVMFLKPEADPSVQNPTLGLFTMEFNRGFRTYAEIPMSFERNEDYRASFEVELRKIRPIGLSPNDIWLGEGGDPNARITVFRHESIASAHHGWVGGRPLTAWVLSYSNFERLYYHLVANYKYWGQLTHRFGTWQIMRNIRVEGEELFVSLLPANLRWKVHTQWTLGYGSLNPGEPLSEGRSTQFTFTDEQDPVGDVLKQLAPRFAEAPTELNNRLNYSYSKGEHPGSAPRSSVSSFAEFEAGLKSLTLRRDRYYPRLLPSLSYIRVHDPVSGEMRVYTVIANRAYGSHESPIAQELARLKSQDNISVFPGIVGSHAHLFFDLELGKSGSFLKELFDLRENGWSAFKARYAIPRSSPRFWGFADWLTEWSLMHDPVHAARLDLSQYDNGLGNI